jgi:hypothetical protein
LTQSPSARGGTGTRCYRPRPGDWVKGCIDDRAMEGHRLAQTVAYGGLGTENPAPITAAYEKQTDPVVEIQLEKAGVRLAYLLNARCNEKSPCAGDRFPSRSIMAEFQSADCDLRGHPLTLGPVAIGCSSPLGGTIRHSGTASRPSAPPSGSHGSCIAPRF